MKKIKLSLAAAFPILIFFTACRKDASEVITKPSQTEQNGISNEVLAQIKSLGLSTSGVQKVADGYLVEGDILLTKEHLESKAKTEFTRVGIEEQYRHANTVSPLPRIITVTVSPALPIDYLVFTGIAVGRYNALGLRITFSMVPAGGDIVITPGVLPANVWASASFPSVVGNPGARVLVNTALMNGCPDLLTKATILAHELGHCIGFHHTDSPGAGAILIPGTPRAGADPNSWMMSGIGCGVNRPFTAYDLVALNQVY